MKISVYLTKHYNDATTTTTREEILTLLQSSVENKQTRTQNSFNRDESVVKFSDFPRILFFVCCNVFYLYVDAYSRKKCLEVV